uniref:Zinc finger homeobox 4 n=1 Tax=Electrophorus electricus TaxID=8005 RepID=A0A4W4G8W5_ELEEL
MPISDRHVYKYRCSQCSLAFKTAEKLQLHSQYHAIRAATMCCLCQRSFRTLQALRKHLETSHLELSEAQLQQLCGSLLMTEDLLSGEDQSLGEEQGSFEEERVKEDEESDMEEKSSPGDSYLSLLREDVEPNAKHFVMPQRKGPNVSTEKFLDPSRPFKCTVCKESFTQKNILLVHYNSVSHLHKVKRSVQDSSGLPESVSSSTDHKPFKCSICNVAYSQSSTLEIHMRSVLHQTKARAAKLDSSGASSVSSNPLLGKAVSLTESTSSSHTALKSALLQSHLFNPALLHHFPITTDALLPLQQQQQFLLPFLIPGGEFQINPELNLKGLGLNLSTAKPVAPEDPSETLAQEDIEDEVLSSGEILSESIPPRVAHDAPGNVSKALLENIGFELVMQFNENKQQYQRNQAEAVPNEQTMPKEVDHSEFFGKLECESCGKLFSNVLILKSHKEHIHQSIFPIHSLEKFAKDYREQYDKLFPFRPATPEASPPPQSPALTPQLPVHLPAVEAGLTPDLAHNPPITTLEDVKVDSRSSSPEPPRHECSAGKRSSRTRFSDFQLKVLQDFFDANAYPKDDEFEQLSSLLNLSTRVIVVWFQNARQKARKNYENQGEGGKDEHREFSNERYIRSSNNYQCKKCNMVFQRIFDLISHQKKVCYKDDDDNEAQFDQNELFIDPIPPTPSESSSPTPTPSTSSLSNCIEKATGKHPNLSHIPSATCIQCKLSFLSFEHWQEHQQMHFLVAQNPFVTPQFLDRPVDILPSVAAIPDSTINSLKRKLEQKSGTTSLENDWDSNVDDPQRDKRMRTTITPEQLEILYQKYLLDSNPTRQMLDHISQEVGLKKRVVQVWFQNTRARERKGQFRALGPVQAHRRCPFCRALFKAQTALDAHIRSRHWHEAKTAGYSMAISGMTQEIPNEVTTDEENFPVEVKHNSIDQLSFSSEREASSESEDKLSSGLVSPAMSFNAKDFENDLIFDYSENSSLADPASPCPGGSNSQNIDADRHGQKRYRTQLSSLQVKVLKACFSDYKTPTMLECEALGNDIGLAKRVVQVWFQNARAKEKKAKLSLAKQFGTESTCTERPKTECTLCGVKYSGCLSVRDHVFSQQHLAKVKEALGGQMDRDREYLDTASVRQLILALQSPPSLSYARIPSNFPSTDSYSTSWKFSTAHVWYGKHVPLWPGPATSSNESFPRLHSPTISAQFAGSTDAA